MRPSFVQFFTLICTGLAFVGVAQGQAYTAEQGSYIYTRVCSSCHGENLQGSGEVPPLAGEAFQQQWRNKRVADLSAHILETMPPNKPRSLGSEDTRSLLAFILARNGAPLRAQNAPAGGATLGALLSGAVVAPVRDAIRANLDAATQKRFDALRTPLQRITPVTNEMLRNPSPNDWLMWRRTYNAWGYSPLNQINRDNVKNLTVAWTWGMESTGMSEFTPLVHDGIMYLWNNGETIQALDATNGNLLWRYHYEMPDDYARAIFYRSKRGLAIGGNKLIFPTTDMHIVALDIKTGDVVWDVVTDDYKKSNRVYNSAPLVVNGKVIMGASGCAPGGVGCFVGAYDLETGKALWRFNTIAQPDEPGGDTWNDVPADRRWGASVWTPPSYDPELNLLYVGTGSPFPWSAVDRGTYNPKGGGNHGDSLYVNSTLAINPDTGKLVWYYQHIPNDTFDQDYSFERVIAPVEWQGSKRKAILTAGKPAVIEVLDAATGKFLFAKDPGAQNIFTFDPQTGVKTLLPPGPPAGIKRCPSNNGARNFTAGAYDPNTSRYYLSVNDVCTGKGGDTPDRMLGLDLNSREFTMDVKSAVVQSTAKLTTAGGLLISASGDRYVRAFDVRDGKVLWQTRVQDVPNAAPISYMVNGKQYVAMVAGNPGLVGNGAARASAEFIRPESTSVLWVWQLP